MCVCGVCVCVRERGGGAGGQRAGGTEGRRNGEEGPGGGRRREGQIGNTPHSCQHACVAKMNKNIQNGATQQTLAATRATSIRIAHLSPLHTPFILHAHLSSMAPLLCGLAREQPTLSTS